MKTTDSGQAARGAAGPAVFIEVAALAFFLVGYLCPFLPPKAFWWTGLAAIGLPFTGLLLVLLTVPLLIRKPIRKPLALAHGLSLVLLAVRFIHPGSWFADPEPSSRDLILMTQNLPSAPIERGRVASRKLLTLVRTVDPHLIGIQEGIVLGLDKGTYRSTREEKFRVLMDSLGYHTASVPESRGQMLPAWHDPVLTRIPIEDQRQIEFEYPADPLEDPVRIVRTAFIWNGRRLIHYNVHLATYGTSKPWRSVSGRPPFSPATIFEYLGEIRSGFIRRAWEARKIRRMIERETDPVIISGDFNCTPNNWAYRHLSAGLQDAWIVSGSGWGATYYSAFPIWRIDFILASRELEPVSVETVPISADVSDHRGVTARVHWRDCGQ